MRRTSRMVGMVAAGLLAAAGATQAPTRTAALSDTPIAAQAATQARTTQTKQGTAIPSDSTVVVKQRRRVDRLGMMRFPSHRQPWVLRKRGGTLVALHVTR